MQVKGIHHSSILVADTRRAIEFYNGILGLEIDNSRPDLGYPGAWLVTGAHVEIPAVGRAGDDAAFQKPVAERGIGVWAAVFQGVD